jgi:hypothetical protein
MCRFIKLPVVSSHRTEGDFHDMKSPSQSVVRIRGAVSAVFQVFLAILILSLWSCAGVQETAPVKETEKAPELPSKPYITMAADRYTKLINHFGQATTSMVRVYRDGYKVRTETVDATPPELFIFDHESRKEYELHAADRIYFETNIPESAYFRAQREGLIPWVKDSKAEMTRYVLGKSQIEGHPCEIVFQVRKFEFPDMKMIGYEYTLTWEALDLGRQPIRVAYALSHQVEAVVDYKNIKTGPIDPSLFKVPDDYLSFTPY